jgi:hypothetical protein
VKTLNTRLRFPSPTPSKSLDFLTRHREDDTRAPESLAPAPEFTGHKYEYAAEQLGYLTGNDLYDAYLAGRLTTAALRKLFLTHIEEPGAACDVYLQVRARLRSGQRA